MTLGPGSILTPAQSSTAPPPLEQAARRLGNDIAVLNDSLENLYAKLAPYISQTEGKSGPLNRPPSPIIGTSSAVMQLSELADRLSLMIVTLDSIKERLEV